MTAMEAKAMEPVMTSVVVVPSHYIALMTTSVKKASSSSTFGLIVRAK